MSKVEEDILKKRRKLERKLRRNVEKLRRTVCDFFSNFSGITNFLLGMSLVRVQFLLFDLFWELSKISKIFTSNFIVRLGVLGVLIFIFLRKNLYEKKCMQKFEGVQI